MGNAVSKENAIRFREASRLKGQYFEKDKR